MRTEHDCKPSERFLQAVLQFSDNTIKTWKNETIRRCKGKEKGVAYDKYISWRRQENEIAVFTMYAFADISIPTYFDCIFKYDNPENFIYTKYTITQSISEGWYPYEIIECGNKHLCILKFEEPIPEIFKVLHYETAKYASWKWDEKRVLGLCQLKDMQAIIEQRHIEAKLRQLHGVNWRDFDLP